MQWSQLKQTLFIRYWQPTLPVIAAGILAALFFGLTGALWAVTGEFTRWGGHLLQLVGIEAETWPYFQIIGLKGTPLDRIGGMIIIGMFLGALIAALWASNVKLRMPQHKRRIAQALIGGIIAGIGARLAMGCNLAAMFAGIPQFSLHAWLFTIATAVGSYLGVKCCLLPMFRVPIKLKKLNRQPAKSTPKSANKSQFGTGMLLLAALLLTAIGIYLQLPKLAIALLFGALFGLLIERAQICFTSAFRDLWLMGRTHMANALILGMAVSAIGVLIFVELGAVQKLQWAGPNTLIGGLLFGFGIVLAGGCETGWMYRAMEGQVHFWWVGLGNIMGATLLAYCWPVVAPLATQWPKVNLLDQFGHIGGLIVTLTLLASTLLLINLWHKRFFKRIPV